MLTLIVARARNGAIGRDGDIPWHAPEDLAMFKRETLGGALIMGRKTWESLPFKPLKNRLNVVVTRGDAAGACATARSVEEALDTCHAQGHRRVYGIGGAQIYAALLPMADRLLITEVDLDIPDADTFFPDIDPSAWRSTPPLPLRSEAPACILQEYLR